MDDRGHPLRRPKRDPTTGEWVRAVVVVLLVAVIVVTLLAWFVATYVIQGCLGPCAA